MSAPVHLDPNDVWRDLAAAVLHPLDRWACQCHAASLELVRSGVLGPSRVARGWCRGVRGQHSWVVLGRDPYLLGVTIVDPTLWSYDPTVSGVWVGQATNGGRHVPHGGHGSIWTYGKPTRGKGPVVELTPTEPLGADASAFLRLLGPLDRDGWALLAGAPVLGWPAGEIIAAMLDTDDLRALVPIDVAGMVTDRDPEGLYLGGLGRLRPRGLGR